MAIVLPGRHPAFKPIGALRKSPFKGGKKGLMMPLNLTAMVDMFTVLVIFLIQSFSASGELVTMQKGLVLPTANKAEKLVERGPVVTLMNNEVAIDGAALAKLEELDDADAGIPALSERLKTLKQQADEMDKRMGVVRDPTLPYDGHLILQADVSTDFELIRKAIFSVNEAGWTHLQFATLSNKKKDEAAEGAAEH